MTDAGARGASGPSDASVAALVEAIDARARQAGTEASSTLLRGMLGSVSEVLGAILDRIDRVEDLLEAGAAGGGDRDGAAAVQEGLDAFNARLGRLEEAFVQAVDDSGSGTQAVVDEVRAVVAGAIDERLTAAASSAASLPSLDPVVARLVGLEQLIRSRGDDRSDGAASSAAAAADAVRASLDPLVERVDGLEVAVRGAADDVAERTSRLAAQVAALDERLAAVDAGAIARVEAQVAAVADRVAAIDAEAIGRVEARLALVDERAAASATLAPAALGRLEEQLAALTDRVERLATDRGAATEADVLGRLERRVAALGEQVGTLAAATDPGSVGRLEERLAAVAGADALGRLEEKLAALADQAERRAATDAQADAEAATRRITDAVRAEAELLTQRVAALAVGVEAARALLEQHVADTEQSVGRRASEFTRKVAADFGLAPRGRQRGRRGDPRELGPG
jgi:hypothetical protein